MHVYISHPELLPDLRAFLERADWVVDRCYGHDLEVHLPGAFSTAQARRELDIYLATWQVTNPGVETYVAGRVA